MTDDFSAQQRTYQAFETLIAREDAEIDLAQGALLIATLAYPGLDAASYIAQLDALAQRVCAHLGVTDPLSMMTSSTEPLTVLQAMNRVLIDEEGFHGNKSDYYNPDNSFLNKVLELRTGIPITLSLVYIEVGRRLGLQLDGIGLPYHFVTRCRLIDSFVYIDPYEGGEFLSERHCRERIRRLSEGKLRVHARWFEPVSHKHFLARILNNLKHIYIEKDEYPSALSVCDLLVLLLPTNPLERRDRGIVYLQLKKYVRALRDLVAYTQQAPYAEDLSEIQEHIQSLRQMIAMMN